MAQVIDVDKYEVIYVSPRNYFIFTPLLAAASVGTVDVRSITEPIRMANPCVQYVAGEVVDIVLGEQKVTICFSGTLIEEGTLIAEGILIVEGTLITEGTLIAEALFQMPLGSGIALLYSFCLVYFSFVTYAYYYYYYFAKQAPVLNGLPS